MRGAPVQSGRGGHQKCARQYPVPTTVTMVYRRFVDFAQEVLPPHSGRREGRELWPEGGPHRRVVGRFFHPADLVIDPGFHAALRQRLAGQQQIDAQPTVIVEAFGAVIKPREMLMIVRG